MSQTKVLLSQYLSPVSEWLDDPDVSEIMINRPDDVWIEARGDVRRADRVIEPNALRAAIRLCGRIVDRDVADNSENAILDAYIGDMRVGAALAPIALEGDTLCLRKHGRSNAPLSTFFPDPSGGVDDPHANAANAVDMPDYLRSLVRAKANILVAGGTSTGKTTFLNALMRGVPNDERLVVIEDTAELHVTQPNRVRLIANPQIGITIRSLLRLSLRLRPDRIVVGEVRGGEAFDLLQAWNTGHDGGCASIHASSPEGALRRLETLVLTANTGWPIEAIRHAIATTLDYVVFLTRRRGKRQFHSLVRVAPGNHDYDLETISC